MAWIDFHASPFLVIWEVTQACDLACVHCRAKAQSFRDPRELTTVEGFRLIDQIREFGQPLFVLTGGDPMKRPDIFDFIAYGTQRGLRMAMTPSGTALMTREAVARLKAHGLARLAISLDGSSADIHDTFRRVPGSYTWTTRCVEYARQLDLPVQINTTMTRHNFDDFDAMAALVERLGIVLWSVFFLVPVGRGRKEDELTPQEYEIIFNKLYDLSRVVPFDIKTTAAPHYRRVVLQRRRAEDGGTDGPRPVGFIPGDGIGRAPKGVNEANGLVFISHTGEVYPSGFLPLSGGNVRERSLVDIYRNTKLFQLLRDSSQLRGKCGYCDFRDVCGGSRARAYALTGNPMASEPYCVYRPPRPKALPHRAVGSGQ
ncbi:MAG: TIGR04053 family radical SAM/SPASM domain-containing protein [Candidatus Latescibacteria bacterium]|nr:TIGR04053 family radical SAM/SPASM domain-containing protein [Candidatus Latescibacterota bacterium]